MKPDFEIDDQGSIVAIAPITEKARAWIDENVQAESWQWFGNALCIDHRYADDLLFGIVEAGFTIQ